ncbi:nucleotide-binding universal stress UspA family protein [Pseudoduganella lurida]|uniref:Nucleotide-binding universal stress UspA family protein n=1 Tax=Pseudoduganella lurida TaxID=1036180 RepID=A0A562QVJ7_9BURK|nr:universal stress protein [Pseudoduganella lurida]TWI60871.1 nucleotide-binding universal stress UspA family protein [Pseudoduganella lurida]
MFTNILFPTDGAELSERVTPQVIEFARLHGARIVAISVAQPFPFVPMTEVAVVPDAQVFDTQMDGVARASLEKVSAAAAAAGVPFEGIIASSPSPSDEIVAAAAQHHCDIIVMASHGRSGLDKLLLGSQTQKVLSHTHLPVLVLRDPHAG